MYENDYMYAIERNDEYLAHYGIRGMKWGVRKAIASGNGRRLGRQYRKAQKKLAKLEKRAASGKKYARRAAMLGAGAAAAGGLAVLGTSGVASRVHGAGRMIGGATEGLGNALQRAGGSKALRRTKLGAAMRTASFPMAQAGKTLKTKSAGKTARAIDKWGKSNTLGVQAGKIADAVKNKNATIVRRGARVAQKGAYTSAVNPNSFQSKFGKVSNNTIARAGAAAIGAGLAGAAGYNAYRAATTKRAARKAAQFRSEMNKAFKGTQYDTSRNRQGKKRRRG